jgi:hypothetical protein
MCRGMQIISQGKTKKPLNLRKQCGTISIYGRSVLVPKKLERTIVNVKVMDINRWKDGPA